MKKRQWRALKLSESYEIIRPAVVGITKSIKRDSGYLHVPIGTGPEWYIITAYHVVKNIIEENDSKLAVMFTKSNQEMFEAQIVMIVEADGNKVNDDYAFVKVKMKEDIKVGY